MAAIGRNEPCPCGSGRKYKKCCLATGGGAPYTQADRDIALQRLPGSVHADDVFGRRPSTIPSAQPADQQLTSSGTHARRSQPFPVLANRA